MGFLFSLTRAPSSDAQRSGTESGKHWDRTVNSMRRVHCILGLGCKSWWGSKRAAHGVHSKSRPL